MMFRECFLKRMQGTSLLQSLDRTNFFSLRLHRKHETRADRLIIKKHRAGAANAVLTTGVRAGLTTIVPDNIDERAT
jgi:hypothetical protein